MLHHTDASSFMRVMDQTMKEALGENVVGYSIEIQMPSGNAYTLQQAFDVGKAKPKDVAMAWHDMVRGAIDEERRESEAKAERRRAGNEIEPVPSDSGTASTGPGDDGEAAVPALQETGEASASFAETLSARRDLCDRRIEELEALVFESEVKIRELRAEKRAAEIALESLEEDGQ